MKNKIKHFAKGEFKLPESEIVFPVTHLEILAGEGEVYQGSFCFSNRREGNIRGLIYPSSFRVHCQEPGFEGHDITVKYTYDSRGLKPGHTEKGYITVVCDSGEYDVSFTAIVERPYILTPYGKIQCLKDFRYLAYKDYGEAHRLFRSREFYEVLKYEDHKIYHLYDHMRKWSLGESAMEEFLVSTKQKEQIFLTLEETETQFDDLNTSIAASVEISKNTWGYLQIDVETDGGFIETLQDQITTDEFVGSRYSVVYRINTVHLHAGYNWGRLLLKTPYEELEYQIVVHQSLETQRNDRDREFIHAQILKSYLAKESGRTDAGEWVSSTLLKIQELRADYPAEELYILLEAQLYLEQGKMDEAKRALENYTYHKFDVLRVPKVSLFYLYLTTKIGEDEEHTKKVVNEIRSVLQKFPDYWELACMLIHLEKRYSDPAEKLKTLERQFRNGANSLLFYYETFKAYLERPELLEPMGDFEVQVLNFAVKYRLVKEELVCLVADLIRQQKSYNKKMCRLVEMLYKQYPENPEILTAVCTQLIKGNKTAHSNHRWFEKAVEADLKIAQLYEYFLITSSEQYNTKKLPEPVYHYFTHGISLDYRATALLYANVIHFQSGNEEIYDAYIDQIETFAWDQLEKRHINESLRIIYRQFCDETHLNPDRVKALYDICHAYKVTTQRDDMKYVMVIDPDGAIRQRVAYDNQEGALLFLYDKESRIVWEGKNGRYYAGSFPCEAVRLFYELKFIAICRKLYQPGADGSKQADGTELTLDNLHRYGLEPFAEEKVFAFASSRIREENYREDEFLLWVCYELFCRGQYDKVILTYLADFYCGSTQNMKRLWGTASQNEIQTKKLSERIITQMLFSETMLQEEKIFADYYDGVPYFRIKQAYLTYVSREYVLNDRLVSEKIFQILESEYRNQESLNDICKIALLKYYSCRQNEGQMDFLHVFMRDLCMKRMVFPFYMEYPESWKREMLLHDKVIVQYKAQEDSRVMLCYQLGRGDMDKMTYETEILPPMYETIYVKMFVLYEEEQLHYYFRESKGEWSLTTEPKRYVGDRNLSQDGRYGRLNNMAGLSGQVLGKAMNDYQREEEEALEVFHIY